MTTTASKRTVRRAVVLVVDHHEWTGRSLESVLSADGHRVILVHTVKKAMESAQAQRPDLVFVNDTLPDGDGLALCQALREDSRFGPGLPILVTTSESPTRAQRLAALRVGAWEFVVYPIDAEDLQLRLRSYLEARFELDRMRDQCLLDETTGLYNTRGLERRTLEIASAASREEQAVACVVLSPTLRSGSIEDDPSSAARWGAVLRSAGRVSDAIGRLGRLEFAVVAPGTDAEGAVQLANRLAQALRSSLDGQEEASFDLRGGFEAIPNARESSIAPTDLLVHATMALQESKRTRNGDWLTAFSPP